MAMAAFRIALPLAGCVASVAAQTVTPFNWTAGDGNPQQNAVTMQITSNQKMISLAQVLPLTPTGGDGIPPAGRSGLVLLANPSNQLNIGWNEVVFIDCDQYPGEIQASSLFQAAWQAPVTAVVFYSIYSDFCRLQDYSANYPWVYSMMYKNNVAKTLGEIKSMGSNMVWAKIVNGSSNGSNSGTTASATNNSGGNAKHPPPGTPSTAVAMIILYAITGIITALFLVIIVTGAIRAHRHPERYGPRNIVGRPRQSRARGLARAIVETLPIVKFGEEHDQAKPTDVELGDAAHEEPRTVNRDQNGNEQTATTDADATTQPGENRQSVDGGIGAEQTNGQALHEEHLGCSICTEDFQPGEDQRVLPCDHKFHPACVDPWLLNVSGTCPLCRIDLRPQTSNTEDTGEVDADGNPIARTSSDPEHPTSLIAEQVRHPQRLSIRQSIVEGFRGLGGRSAPPMTEQEARARAATIRQWREQFRVAQWRTEAEAQAAGAATPPVEEERSRRARFRRVFGIRTRRTGQGEVQDENEGSSPSPAPGSTSG